MNTARAWILVLLLGAAGGPASLTGQNAPGGTPRPAGQAPRVLFEDDLHSVRRWREGGSEACKTSYGDRGFIVEDLPPQGSCEFDLLQAGAFPDHVRIELSVRLRKGDLSSPFGLKFGRGPMDNHLFHTFTI